MGNAQGTRWRGKLPIPPHAHPMVRRLFREMNSQMTTIGEVAARAGLRPGTISDWRYRRNPKVGDLEAAFNVLDFELSVKRRVA